VKEHYDWSFISQKLDQIYLELAGKKNHAWS
jgi:hypothetical protein